METNKAHRNQQSEQQLRAFSTLSAARRITEGNRKEIVEEVAKELKNRAKRHPPLAYLLKERPNILAGKFVREREDGKGREFFDPQAEHLQSLQADLRGFLDLVIALKEGTGDGTEGECREWEDLEDWQLKKFTKLIMFEGRLCLLRNEQTLKLEIIYLPEVHGFNDYMHYAIGEFVKELGNAVGLVAKCKWCKEPYLRVNRNQDFCSDECKEKH